MKKKKRTMTVAQEAHIIHITHLVSEALINKYEKGALEHGGNLWEKTGIVDMIIDEGLDFLIYGLTLKQQIESHTIYTVTGKDTDKKINR